MSDFTYDNEDFTAVRVATKDLQRIERESLLINTGFMTIFIVSQYLTRNKPSSFWNKSPLAVIATSALTSSVL